MASPSNFVVTNPVVQRRILETGGQSLVQGFRNFLDDWERIVREAVETDSDLRALALYRLGRKAEALAAWPGMPDGVIASMPLLESWGIPTRLTSLAGHPGCHDGFVTDLADRWLRQLKPGELTEIKIFACGPTPMLKAVAALAERYGVACEVSLEEFMACAVGGCAGCAVPIHTPAGLAMKRVCVDGPVFDAAMVAW